MNGLIPGSRSVSHDIAPDGLLLITSVWSSGSIWARHDLICDDNSNAKLGYRAQS